ncbi:hypothetical protein [Inediibacterium massiliense]|uniref:hypothetical protein n=1 Tax=Inediibacterium massiliense TaxID=1658111 RepID=UPI0018FEBBEF|nr:hypothetical protein [Inediibacterium massiliense]
MFNDITYIPFTSDILTYLNVSYEWDNPSYLIFNRTSAGTPTAGTFSPNFQNGNSAKGSRCNIVKIDKGIMVNETQISNQYPIINAKNINYLPLTADIISSLGLSRGWNPTTGFELTVK